MKLHMRALKEYPDETEHIQTNNCKHRDDNTAHSRVCSIYTAARLRVLSRSLPPAPLAVRNDTILVYQKSNNRSSL